MQKKNSNNKDESSYRNCYIFKCEECSKHFRRQDNLLRHRNIVHSNIISSKPIIHQDLQMKNIVDESSQLSCTNQPKNYIWMNWEDPNELVDRLRLLVICQIRKGIRDGESEINAIIEELRKADIIE